MSRDLPFAGALAGALIMVSGLTWWSVGAAVAGCAALLWVRRYPVVVVSVIGPAFVASLLLHLHSSMPLLIVAWITLYGVPAFAPRRRAAIVGIAALVTAIGVLVAMGPITQAQSREGMGLAVVLVLGYVASAWFLGLYHSSRRDQIVAEERNRIARELHDTLAHTMSGMVVLAGGGRRLAQTNPDAAVEVLARIEEVGRQGMSDTRQVLKSIRSAPTLDDLSTLVDQVRETGLPVEVSTSGRPTVMPPKVGVAAYRIVQESLTNVLRHAGPATAHVDLRYRRRTLEVEVRDDGHGSQSPPGHGLTGMRERAALAGASFTAGPRPEGGWSVRAVFPA